MKACRICGWKRASRKGRCAACNQFFRRHGRDKTPADVMQSYERFLDRVAKILA